MSILESILSSRARAEVFRLLFGLVDPELHGREIGRRSGLAIGTVRHELKKLEGLDLVTARRDGNRLYYRANRRHPLHREIHNLVLKTVGMVELLREKLPEDGIRLAFVFGSVARGEEDAESDVDLLVVGDVGLRDLARCLSGISDDIGREVNPHILNANAFADRVQKREYFITRVLDSPRLFVIGSEDELAGLVEQRMVAVSRDD